MIVMLCFLLFLDVLLSQRLIWLLLAMMNVRIDVNLCRAGGVNLPMYQYSIQLPLHEIRQEFRRGHHPRYNFPRERHRVRL